MAMTQEERDAQDAASLVEAVNDRITAYRKEKERGEVSVLGMTFTNDEKTEARILGAWVQAKLNPLYTVNDWKIGDVFIDLTNVQLIGIGDTLNAHLKKCFTAEKVVTVAHSATPYTSITAVETAYDTAYANA